METEAAKESLSLRWARRTLDDRPIPSNEIKLEMLMVSERNPRKDLSEPVLNVTDLDLLVRAVTSRGKM